jgi:hypothetical protein
MNPNNRYIEILANLHTEDKQQTPMINSITLKYRDGTGSRTVVIDTQSSISQAGNVVTAGFASNTWDDVSPVLRIRNDTNDNYNIITTATGEIKLAAGEYQKLYNSEGDWDDGETINLRTTPSGTLKLSI